MKIFESITFLNANNLAYLAVAYLLCFGVAKISQKYLGNDNYIEQRLEAVVKEVTNIDTDFSPENENKSE
jgi:hypothetical protein